MKYIIALIIALFLNAGANLLIKIGMTSVADGGGLLKNGIPKAIKAIFTTTPLIIGLICFALNAAFYMYALQSKTLKISIAYPIMVGGGFALIAIIAKFHPALHERLTGEQLVGVALIFIGIILVAAKLNPSVS